MASDAQFLGILECIVEGVPEQDIVAVIKQDSFVGNLISCIVTPVKTDVHANACILCLRAAIVLSQSEVFCSTIAASDHSLPFLDYLLNGVRKYSSTGPSFLLFVSILTNLSRNNSVLDVLQGSSLLEGTVDHLFCVLRGRLGTDVQNRPVDVAQTVLYLLINLGKCTRRSPSLLTRYAHGLDTLETVDHIVRRGRYSLLLSRLMKNTFLALKYLNGPVNISASASSERQNEIMAILNSLAERALACLFSTPMFTIDTTDMADQDTVVTDDIVHHGLSLDEFKKLPDAMKAILGQYAEIKDSLTLTSTDASQQEILANIADSYLLYAFYPAGLKHLRELNYYALFRECYMEIVRVFGDDCAVVDSLLGVIEALIADDNNVGSVSESEMASLGSDLVYAGASPVNEGDSDVDAID